MLRTQLRAGPLSGLLLSLLTAAFLTFVQLSDALVETWAPHFGSATEVTLRVPYGPRVLRDEVSRTVPPFKRCATPPIAARKAVGKP